MSPRSNLAASIALLVAGCGGGDAVPGPNFSDVRPLLDTYCNGCHGSRVVGADRQGAPAHEVLDDPDPIKAWPAHALRTLLPAGNGQIRGERPMPPPGARQPTEAERQVL